MTTSKNFCTNVQGFQRILGSQTTLQCHMTTDQKKYAHIHTFFYSLTAHDHWPKKICQYSYIFLQFNGTWPLTKKNMQVFQWILGSHTILQCHMTTAKKKYAHIHTFFYNLTAHDHCQKKICPYSYIFWKFNGTWPLPKKYAHIHTFLKKFNGTWPLPKKKYAHIHTNPCHLDRKVQKKANFRFGPPILLYQYISY